MRALGLLRDERAVARADRAAEVLGKGEGAWSALDALARIAHPSSAAVFTERLDRPGSEPAPRRRRGARAASATQRRSGALETGAGNDPSAMVRAAMAYALQKMGRNYVPRLVEFLDDGKVALQVQDYLLELGRADREGAAAQPAGARRSDSRRGRRGARRDRRRAVAGGAPEA